MALSGTRTTRIQVPYSGAGVWGTGSHPIHAQTGEGDPIRVMDPRTDSIPYEYTPAAAAQSDPQSDRSLWGYTQDDSSFVGLEYDDRPTWNMQPEGFRGDTDDQPSWAAPGIVNDNFRATAGGAYRSFRSQSPILSPVEYMEPSETVSEGWRNKVAGEVAIAKPSDPAQYERQTSMQQRFQTRNNRQAVARATDVPRAGIRSRVEGMIVKVYSGNERHYDMLPKEQDAILRPFWYRTAGTGRIADMESNQTVPYRVAVERQPPPDPSIGYPETAYDYGYTGEDQFYA